MKTKFYFLLLAATALLASCQTNPQPNQNTVSQTNVSASPNVERVLTEKGVYTVEMKTAPIEIKAGEKTDISFIVKNPGGELVRDLQIVHEKPIHLLIVSDDLSEFYHEHPEQQTDGSHKVSFSFPNSGNYQLYVDLTPAGAVQLVQDFPVSVGGTDTRAAKNLIADTNFEKTAENLRVVMKPSGDLVSEEELTFDFTVFDAATDQPVTDLENYLGEKAHFVVISRDLQEFVHAHPMSGDNVKTAEHAHAAGNADGHDEKTASSARSTVSAHVTFPKPSTYRLWAQFKRAGKVVTVPFTFDVKQGAANDAADLSKVKFPDDAIKVIVTKDGFTPQEISFQQGKSLKLAFYRADAENCASEIVFKELNIRRKLPVGEIVAIDVPTEKAGEFSFACGMDMYRGKIVVR